MPGVAAMMARRRAEVGPAHVALCWRRGVVEQKPGWFFAQEGALAVGTPWDDDPDIAAYIKGRITPTQVLLVLRPVQAAQEAAC